jgi:anti-anti-sigma factor
LLRFAVDEQGPAPIVCLAGELDWASTPILLDALAKARALGASSVVLELSRLIFCDVAGGRAIYQWYEKSKADGVSLELRNPHSAVQRVLELSGVLDLWTMRPASAAGDDVQAHSARLAGVMDAAIHAVSGSMGTAQYFDSTGDTLHLVAHRGFAHPFVSFFETVRGYDTSCGAAAQDLRPVYVEDVATSPIFAASPELDALVEAGVGSCASIPISTPRRGLLGVVSTHRSRPGPWDPSDRNLLEQVQLYAGQVTAA